MILPKYQDAFRALTPEEIGCIVEGLSRSRPELYELPDMDDGIVLYDYCRASHVSQAEVIMGLARDTRLPAISAVERLLGRPIDRRTPAETAAERAPPPRPERAPRTAPATAGDERVIRLLVTENPKRAGTASHGRYALYRDGMSVREYLSRGGTRGDITWDAERRCIALEDV